MASVQATHPCAQALPSAERRDHVPLGIALMIGATLFLTLSNVLSKQLVTQYPVGEVMALRSFIALGLAMAFLLPRHGTSVFATARPRAHVARGLSQAVSQTLTVAALGLMPLAGATAIGFSAPLFAALVGIVWCREPADPMRWAVLIVGFLGVLIVTSPGADSLQAGALFALGNAVMYGSVTVAVRSMTRTEKPATLLAWQMAVMAVAHTALLPFGLRCPAVTDLGFFAALGASHIGAQYLWTRALALAPANAVSPFYYLMLLWSMGLGWLVFGEVPTLALIVGGAVVAAAGLLLLWHETLKRRLGGAQTWLRPRSWPTASRRSGPARPQPAPAG